MSTLPSLSKLTPEQVNRMCAEDLIERDRLKDEPNRTIGKPGKPKGRLRIHPALNRTDEQKRADFWHRVNIISKDECWLWTESLSVKGYGYIHNIPAHRLAYLYFYGVDAGELCVCHKCDNPPCCNPHHLFLGTTMDNIADKLQKGRQMKGETASGAKLKVDQVLAIRNMMRDGVRTSTIANQFGIHVQAVRNIHRRISWAHLPEQNLATE